MQQPGAAEHKSRMCRRDVMLPRRLVAVALAFDWAIGPLPPACRTAKNRAPHGPAYFANDLTRDATLGLPTAVVDARVRFDRDEFQVGLGVSGVVLNEIGFFLSSCPAIRTLGVGTST